MTGNGRAYGPGVEDHGGKAAADVRRTTAPSAAELTGALACGRRCPCAAAGRRGYGTVHCPAHDDHHPSLVVHEREGRVLFHCKAGCTQAAVIATLRNRGLWSSARAMPSRRSGSVRPDRSATGPRGTGDAREANGVGRDTPKERTARSSDATRARQDGRRTEHRYLTATGEVVAMHVRLDLSDGGKRMWWEDADGHPSTGRIKPERLPLYRLPHLLRADPETPVLLVEGEKSADAAAAAGMVAVSLAGGASQRDFGTALAALCGRRVVLWPDFDPPGDELMRRVAAALAGHAAAVRWVTPMALLDSSDNQLPKGYDAADYLHAGHTAADIHRILAAAGPVPELPQPDGPGAATPHVPPFPVGVLSPVARRFVVEAAAALDCPPDLVALPLLGFAAGSMGNRFAIVLKPDWRQRPILWCAIVAHPGSAKTPAQSLARCPLDVLQREAHERFRLTLKDHEVALAEWSAPRSKEQRGAKHERPEEEHFYTTDSTPEAVSRMLGHPQSCTVGFVIERDELVGWVRGFDAYKAGRGGERQTWLSLWAGAAFKSDCVGRDSYFVLNPTVSVVGGIQPDALPALQAEAGQRDGFIERFVWAYPDTRPMRWSDATISPDALDALTATFRALRYAGTPGTVALHPDARALFRAWVDDNATAQEQVTGLLRGIFAKLPNQAGRLVLVLHALAHPDDPTAEPVSATTMAGALELAEYVRAHAARVMAHFGEAAAVAHPLGVRVLRVLRADGGWVARGDLHEKLGGHIPAAYLTAALAELARAGLAESCTLPSGEQGGRPREEWRATTDDRGEETEETEQTPDGDDVSSVSSVSSPEGSGNNEGEPFEL